jgi:hypothetical protein
VEDDSIVVDVDRKYSCVTGGFIRVLSGLACDH